LAVDLALDSRLREDLTLLVMAVRSLPCALEQDERIVLTWHTDWPNVPKTPDDDPLDTNGHGTHVAGIIAGKNDWYTGVAPEATLLGYKVFGPVGLSLCHSGALLCIPLLSLFAPIADSLVKEPRH
jgi:subtilisin family serine protease